MLSKTVGVILGTLMVITSFGYGILYLLGRSLGKALGSNIDTTTSDIPTLVTLMIICILGAITGVGCFRVKLKGWRIVYIGFSLLLGIGFLVTFFISIGALGEKIRICDFIDEHFIFFISLFSKKREMKFRRNY